MVCVSPAVSLEAPLLCSAAGLCLAGRASQTIGKDLLKVMVSFILLFNAGSVEAGKSYLLPGVAAPLGARLTTPDRLSDGGAWSRREMKMSVREGNLKVGEEEFQGRL